MKPDMTDNMIEEAEKLAKHFLDPDYQGPAETCAKACSAHASFVKAHKDTARLGALTTLMCCTLVRAARNGGVPSKPAGRRIVFNNVPFLGKVEIPMAYAGKEIAIVMAFAYVILRIHGVSLTVDKTQSDVLKAAASNVVSQIRHEP